MANFKRSDLHYEKQYTWKRDEGDSSYKGTLDRIKVDRDEGYEVLYLANSILNDKATKNDLFKLEVMLREKMPQNIIMRDEMKDFIRKNWK